MDFQGHSPPILTHKSVLAGGSPLWLSLGGGKTTKNTFISTVGYLKRVTRSPACDTCSFLFFFPFKKKKNPPGPLTTHSNPQISSCRRVSSLAVPGGRKTTKNTFISTVGYLKRVRVTPAFIPLLHWYLKWHFAFFFEQFYTLREPHLVPHVTLGFLRRERRKK